MPAVRALWRIVSDAAIDAAGEKNHVGPLRFDLSLALGVRLT